MTPRWSQEHCKVSANFSCYGKSSVKPPRGLFISSPFEVGLNRDQHAKKVVSNGPGLVEFAIGLVIFVLKLPDGQVLFLEKFKLQKDCNQSC